MNNFQRKLQAPNNEASVTQVSLRLERGGLAQIFSLKGGSRTWFALSCLGQFLKNHTGDPPLSLWVSDDSELYPEAIHHYWGIPLSRVLLIKTPSSEDAWKVSVDAVQTGLFAWVFLKTDRAGEARVLRKLQILSEKTQTKVLLLCQAKLPHWTLKTSVEVLCEPST